METGNLQGKRELNKKILILLAVLYFVALIWVIIFKCNNNASLHIERNRAMTIAERLAFKAIPFQKTIGYILEGRPLEILATIFNVVCFMPMTALFRYFKMSRKASLWTAIAISFGVEAFQLFSCWGGPDASDIILNGIGAYLGLLLFDKVLNNATYKAQLIGAWCCAAVALPIDIYAIINTAMNFPE